MNRRTLIMLVLGAASASVLEACAQVPTTPAATSVATPVANPTSAGASTSAAPAPTSPPSTPQPKSGGTIRQGYQGDPVSLDPMLKVQNDVVWLGVFERLTAYDANLKPQPMLAESWEVSSDARSTKINL